MSTTETLQDVAPANTGAPPPAYERLDTEKLALLLRWSSDGLTQVEIAQRLGCSQPAVSQALKRIGPDATELASAYFRGRAYKVARRMSRIAEKGKDGDAVKAGKVVLAASGVLKEDTAINVGVQVVLGMPGQSIGPPLDVRVQTLTTPVSTPAESTT